MTAPAFPQAVHDTLDAGLATLGLDAAALAPPLLAYLALLARWNRTYNLTAIRDPHEMVTLHLLDSLAMHPFVTDLAAANGRLADLGTGAGLPGIPLALAYPQLQVTLVESSGKKARFLREAVRTLGPGNIRVAQTRIEALGQRGAFDAITARALATLPIIVELGGPLLRPGGRLLAMKGTHPLDEIAALPAGWQMQGIHPLHVPGLDAERHLVSVLRIP